MVSADTQARRPRPQRPPALVLRSSPNTASSHLFSHGRLLDLRSARHVRYENQIRRIVISAEGFQMLLHEIGHALGLKHPHDAVQGDRIRSQPTNTDVFPGVTFQNPVRYWRQQPKPIDLHADELRSVAACRRCAGCRPAYDGNADGARRRSHSTALWGQYNHSEWERQVSVLPDPGSTSTMQAIWDTGGVDEIVYSGSASCYIDLRPATLDDSVTGGGMLSLHFHSGRQPRSDIRIRLHHCR